MKVRRFSDSGIEGAVLCSDRVEVRVLSVGCALQSVVVDGVDIVLGYSEATKYEFGNGKANFGTVVGRYANRIGRGVFSLDGVQHQLGQNNQGKHHLHGGERGFFSKTFKILKLECNEHRASVWLSYTSPHMEELYPGTLHVTVMYCVTSAGEFGMEFTAQAIDHPTIVNLCNHAYFNLGGHDSGTVLDHELHVEAKSFTPVNEELIITGEVKSVEGTALDFFSVPRCVGSRIQELPLDHNFCLLGNESTRPKLLWREEAGGGELELPLAAVLRKPAGLGMEVYTNQRGLQVYSGNFINAADPIWRGKGGALYDKFHAICLETQNWPDAINNLHNNFPDPTLRPGQEPYHHVAVFKFISP